MVAINIVIVGAANWSNGVDPRTIESPVEWNNPQQAKFQDLLQLRFVLQGKGHIVTMVCLDLSYRDNTDNFGVIQLKEAFCVDNPVHLRKDCLNVVVEFCNLLNEEWCMSFQQPRIGQLKDYRVALVACGCAWDKGFPSSVVGTIVDQELVTPMDPFLVDNYLSLIGQTDAFRSQGILEMMNPFIKGCFMVMGTLLIRGYKGNDYATERVVRELVELTMPVDAPEVQEFLAGNKPWNYMSRATREALCHYVYGMVTDAHGV